VGGAGKTPAAIWIAGELKRRGRRPAFLSRGYGGRIRGPHIVDAAQDISADVGDEPLLLARTAPTVVCRDRALGAQLIEALDADVIVMDDGLQNPSIIKDLSIGVVDAATGIGNGLVIPAGPLRAPLAAQLPLVRAILSIASGEADRGVPSIPGWRGPVHSASLVAKGDAGWLSGQRVIAFAGLGRPEKFFATLRSLGAEIVSEHGFPDHHPYTGADAERLLAAAKNARALLVTTEKDFIRLKGNAGLDSLWAAARPLPVRLDMADIARLAIVDLLGSLRRAEPLSPDDASRPWPR
jgi:tetraacyldisaccharide 4'-kinase